MRRAALAVLALLLLVPALPAAPLPSDASPTKLTPVARVPFSGGNDVALRGHYAYLSSFSGTAVIDIADPERPVLVSSVPCLGHDIDVLQAAGRTILTVSYQGNDNCPGASGAGGVRVVDVTDPAHPVVGKQVALDLGSHTNTAYGDTGIVYNSAYNLLRGPLAKHGVEILDVSDPANPRLVKTWPIPMTSANTGCHDIYADPARHRAYCAGISETMVWDTTDPLNPVVLADIINPLITIHHGAATMKGGSVLVIADEFLGGGGPGCAVQAELPAGPAQGLVPLGALWFYDLTVPQAPVPLGYFSPPPPPSATNTCTTHNFNLVDDAGIIVSSEYRAGSFLVDATNPTLPRLLDHRVLPNTDSWSTYASHGYAYSGDTNRGLDVYRLDP